MTAHIPDARELNRKPLNTFKPFFATLDPPHPDSLAGLYEASFTGPGWLRLSAGPSLAVGGLGGWWGKEFTPGGGMNIVLRQGRFQRIFPFRITLEASAIDGKQAIIVRYSDECPFPWTHIFDELRQIEAGRLLGMTLVEAPGLHRLAFPFLLEYRGQVDGL